MEKRIELNDGSCTVLYSLDDIKCDHPIYARKDGIFGGMLVREDRGWIHRTGGRNGVSGWHNSREKAISESKEQGYTFYVDGY